jgi:hypothetical protein
MESKKPPAKPTNDMFNLEKAIADWRRQMLAAGIETPVPLEELESHLREEIERQMKSGLDAPAAFEISIRQIGQPETLNHEFNKSERTFMIRIVAMLMALFGTVLGGAMVLPALGQWRDRGVLHRGPLLMGIALAIIAGCAVIYGVRTHRGAQGRKLIGMFVMAAGTFYVVPLIQAFFFSKFDWTGWTFCAVLATASILFYGSCLYRLWRSPAPPIGEG